MIELLVTAPASNSGKTTCSCALLELLRRQGLSPCAFKCGPDYIDPMFHRAVLGLPSHNLDLFLMGEETVKKQYARYSAGHTAVLVEGVMAHYDGVGGTDRASAWHLAGTLSLPALLVLRPGQEPLVPQILSRPDHHIRALLLCDYDPVEAGLAIATLEPETGLPVLGVLPHREDAAFPHRHLGLITADEQQDLAGRVALLADALEEHLDFDRFTALFTTDRPAVSLTPGPVPPAKCTIAVARDEAFCFLYAEALDALREAGAELRFFSPLRDEELPVCDGLYLPGGYPELHAKELSDNDALRRDIFRAVRGGLPTVAECGGFLYLGKELMDNEDQSHPMCGVFDGTGIRTDRPVRFGYAELTATYSGLLLDAGQTVPVHSFHYWDSTENGSDLHAVKPGSGRTWETGFVSETLYAAFEHLHFAGTPECLRRFVAACVRQREKAR